MNIYRRSPVKEVTIIEDINEESLLVKQFKNLKETRLNERLLLVDQLNNNSKKDKGNMDVSNYLNSNYDEIEKKGCVYIISTDKKGIYKCGRTKGSTNRRVRELQTACINTINILFEYRTGNEVLLETLVHYILDRYRVNSNREHFECDLDFMKMVIEYNGKMIDTCKSAFHTIPKDEFIHTINKNVNMSFVTGSYNDNSGKLKTLLEKNFEKGGKDDYIMLKEIKDIVKKNDIKIKENVLINVINFVFDGCKYVKDTYINDTRKKKVFKGLKK